MDIKTAREKLNNLAYSHPENTKNNRGTMYKTFSDTDNTTKNNIDKFKSTVVGKTYAAYGDTTVTDKCPICKQIPVSICNCIYSDRTCANNHKWYVNRDGEIVKGNPHI